jgi:hypothetical protein
MNSIPSAPEVLDLWRRCAPPDSSERDRVLAFYAALVRGGASLDELPLPVEILNPLRRNGVVSAEELRAMSWGSLISLKGIGPTRAREIRRVLGVQ